MLTADSGDRDLWLRQSRSRIGAPRRVRWLGWTPSWLVAPLSYVPSEAHGAPACAARCGQRCRLRFCGHQILDRGLHRRSVIDNERPGRTQLTQWYRQLSEKDNGREGRNSRAVRRCGALPARSLLAPDGL